MNGKFIISLDFELHWGVFDAFTLEQYQSNLDNVRIVIKRLVELSNKYNIKLTFATVGFLFAPDKETIKRFMPKSIPNYTNQNLNPFKLIDSIGSNENDAPLHYAKSVIEFIKKDGNHEIGSHTFSHYNCLASGQNTSDFNDDLIAAKRIANDMGIELNSIVFPKNQVNQKYLEICKNNGITNYRGTENHFLYNPNHKKKNFVLFHRALRLIDGYFNISGYHTYAIKNLKPDDIGLINLPSSRFLRPFIPRLSFLEYLKTKRIKKAMRHAAVNNDLFHLWWHPHNFGADMDINFNNLENIFKTYADLNKKYQFESVTMTGLTNEILKSKSKNS